MNGVRRTRLAVMASGTGTNFLAIAAAAREGRLLVEIPVLICDKPGAKALTLASRLGIDSVCVSPKEFESREAMDAAILEVLQERDVELVALAGYMRIIGQPLLDAYQGRIVNIHPSLLPHFPGVGAIEETYVGGHGGVTVHLIDEGVDTGPILAQQPVHRFGTDTLETFEARVHRVEHALYPGVLQALIDERRTEAEERSAGAAK